MPRRLLSVLPLLAAALLACRAARPEPDRVVDLVRSERYDDAVVLAEELARRSPNDPEVQAMLRRARVVRLLATGRRVLFEGRHEEALALFERAQEIEPGIEVVEDWVLKTRRELADRWLDVALDRSGRGDLEATLEAYQNALGYVPGHPQAVSGAARTVFLINYRQGVGRDYYDQGLEALHENMLPTARSRFESAAQYDPGNARAERRRDEVMQELAEQRFVVARGLEEQDFFGAAMNEFRLVLMLDPENEEAAAGRDRMQREVEVQRLLSRADVRIRKREYEEAMALLDGARELTRLQEDEIARRVNLIEAVRWDELYERALALERDFRYEEALELLDQLLEEAGWYEDAAARKSTLEDFVAEAEKLYARAEETDDPGERARLLRQISVFWPQYRDIEERLAALEE